MTIEDSAAVRAGADADEAVPGSAGEAAPAPPFDTFIFDLDGTLLDTLPDLTVLTNEALSQEGYPPRTQDEIHSFVGNGLMALMYQAVPEGTDAGAAERAMERWKSLFPTYGNDLTVPYPEVREMLSDLLKRGCNLGVLSNKFDAGVQQVIGQKLPGFFEVAHGECAEIPRKPDPTGLLRTIRELGSAPGRTVYVGDSPGDVRTARNAGTFAVAVTWGYHDEADFSAEGADPDLMARSPLDLLSLAPASAGVLGCTAQAAGSSAPAGASAPAEAAALASELAVIARVGALSAPAGASAPAPGVSRETPSDAALDAEGSAGVSPEGEPGASRETPGAEDVSDVAKRQAENGGGGMPGGAAEGSAADAASSADATGTASVTRVANTAGAAEAADVTRAANVARGVVGSGAE